MRPVANALKTVAGVLALLPCVGEVSAGLHVPPSYDGMFRGGAVALGTLTLLVVWLMGPKIRGASRRKVICVSLAMFLIAIASLGCHLWWTGLCLATMDDRTVFYPVIATADLANAIRDAGGRVEALYKYGHSYMEDLIANHHPFALSATTVLLFLTYATTFSGLTAGLAVAAHKAGAQPR